MFNAGGDAAGPAATGVPLVAGGVPSASWCDGAAAPGLLAEAAGAGATLLAAEALEAAEPLKGSCVTAGEHARQIAQLAHKAMTRRMLDL
jgi:hypothetical protein